MKKQRNTMNDPFGWDFQDHLQALLEPDSKLEAIKNFFMTWIMFIPIMGYIFISFLVCSIIGLVNKKGGGIVK